jgi:hypothetical protein
MPPGQVEELLALLDQQWHALAKTDNLLGPRVALGGVRAHLGVIDELLRTARSATRAQLLALGSRYAESAAWLYEDSGEPAASRYWIGRSMEYAVVAGDRLMTSWTLFRKSQQATAGGDAAQAAGPGGGCETRGRQAAQADAGRDLAAGSPRPGTRAGRGSPPYDYRSRFRSRDS